ncbi:uncharacterized protein DFL_008009 [Arthrobotrys flagrans]|uniref:Uncharacterized protein n=1 Tax=Arthrobotrys flagrans TaxID=97331 RepID=A0A436ZXA8_ARTFL|nr:hypothetical protein DFL_008009 [Arthrobotrys flagrans]
MERSKHKLRSIPRPNFPHTFIVISVSIWSPIRVPAAAPEAAPEALAEPGPLAEPDYGYYSPPSYYKPEYKPKHHEEYKDEHKGKHREKHEHERKPYEPYKPYKPYEPSNYSNK